jgi:hypothetical protein
MTTLPKALRAELDRSVPFPTLEVVTGASRATER